MPFSAELVRGGNMPEKFNELLLKQVIIALYNAGITPDYGYLMNGRFEKDMVKTLYPLKTLSGNPISWEASDKEYLFPVVSLEPKQAGTGDPSPENVRPISGYDSLAVNVRGKNLLSDENFQSSENNGITFTKMGNGVVHIEGTASGNADSNIVQDVPQLPPGIYIGISSSLLFVVKKASTGQNNWYNAKAGFSIESGDVIQYWYLSEGSGEPVNKDVYIFLVAGNLPQQASDFEPYQPGTSTPLTLPETIYGGTVDAVTGAGEVTRKANVLDGEINKLRVSDSGFWVTPDGFAPGIANAKAELICTIAPPTAMISNSTYQFIGFSNTWATQYFADVDEFNSFCKNQATAGTPVQVAYKLATPEPFQATGNQPLTSLLGYNTIYTNGDSITLNRKARRLEV